MYQFRKLKALALRKLQAFVRFC